MPDSDDPFLPPDPTHRPRPGAGRRGMQEPGVVAGPRRCASPRRRAHLRGGARDPRHRAESARPGGHPAAAARRPDARRCRRMDVAGLRRHALDEIRRFEEQARASGVRSEIVLAARYTLCAGLDEAVLSTPWGTQSEWAQHPRARRAAPRGVGRREVLRHAGPHLERPGAAHRSDGAAVPRSWRSASRGKYQMQERGQDHLAELQRDLYRRDPRTSAATRRAGAVAALARSARTGATA